MPEPLLRVEDLHVQFGVGPGAVMAVRGVSFTAEAGKTLGLVGESGSGKSVSALAVPGLISPPGRVTAGRILFEGRDLLKESERALRAVRGSQIAMVFQDPLTALSPTLTIGQQMTDVLHAHRRLTRKEALDEAAHWLGRVRITLPERRLRQYPMELSGGMRQRVMIAMAFSCHPKLLIADEPTTALDVTVQAQILDLVDELERETGTGILLITHDLGVVAERCDEVAVMYRGQIVESGPTRQVFSSPQHPYTQSLLASVTDWRHPRQPLAV
ncbi:MAG: peptide transporter ATP-binding protein [Capsulimonas sp.]|jgi:peptide/nickel transport system ATP-binding protein|nr:peptide transporter ATP-binding protein [Capsulimonas sp.]